MHRLRLPKLTRGSSPPPSTIRRTITDRNIIMKDDIIHPKSTESDFELRMTPGMTHKSTGPVYIFVNGNTVIVTTRDKIQGKNKGELGKRMAKQTSVIMSERVFKSLTKLVEDFSKLAGKMPVGLFNLKREQLLQEFKIFPNSAMDAFILHGKSDGGLIDYLRLFSLADYVGVLYRDIIKKEIKWNTQGVGVEKTIGLIVRILDMDNDGYITRDEFDHIFTTLMTGTADDEEIKPLLTTNDMPNTGKDDLDRPTVSTKAIKDAYNYKPLFKDAADQVVRVAIEWYQSYFNHRGSVIHVETLHKLPKMFDNGSTYFHREKSFKGRLQPLDPKEHLRKSKTGL